MNGLRCKKSHHVHVLLSNICYNVNSEFNPLLPCCSLNSKSFHNTGVFVNVTGTPTLMPFYCFSSPITSQLSYCFSTSRHMMARLPIRNSSTNKTLPQDKKVARSCIFFIFKWWKTNKRGSRRWPGFEHESGHFYHLQFKDYGVSKLDDLFVTIKLLLQPLGREED